MANTDAHPTEILNLYSSHVLPSPRSPYPHPQQDELVKEQAVVYNKEDMLNPYFVVFGKRREGAVAPK